MAFDDIMSSVKNNSYNYIEQAVCIDVNILMEQLTTFVNNIKKDHKNILMHVHQYTGTTKLSEALENITSVKTILDKTNFYEHPVNYKELYPNINALISIPQCAGFNIKAGEWIIPKNFMNYDIINDIIYTNKITVENNASEYFPYNYTEGTIIIVDNLWNPNIDDRRTILLFDVIDSKVYEFVKMS